MRRNAAISIGLALLAVPAAVIAASGSGSSTVGWQTTRWTDEGASVNEKSFKPVPGMANQDVEPDCQNVAVDVSADMRRGRALVRVLDETSDEVAQPGPVLFGAKGSNAFTFLIEGFAGNLTVEWKRVGERRAAAASFSAHAIGQKDCG
jgi:hypothetical protein